ncbi:MAG: phosphoenolpyruvate synthase regulatory protein, partial [Alphaproteobacteria bacterium]
TSIYLANRGYKTANIPIIPNKNLPEQLTQNLEKSCIIGLICDPARLSDVRRNRVQFMHEDRPGEYTNEKKIINELENSKKLFRKYNWPIIDVTRKSVEETAASIIKIFDILNSK